MHGSNADLLVFESFSIFQAPSVKKRWSWWRTLYLRQAEDNSFTPVSGGLPLMVGKECVDGIGVGGGVGGQDSQIAKYVIDTFSQLING